MSSILVVGAFAQAATAATPPAPPPSPTPPVAAAAAAADVQRGQTTYVDLDAGAGYSTNPQFGFDGDSGAGFGRFSVRGVHTRFSARASTVLSAFAQTYFYTQDVGSQQSFSLNATHNARVNETLSLFGGLGLSYDKGGRLDTSFGGPSGIPFIPGQVDPSIILPPGSDFLSVTGKTFRANTNFGGQWALNAREFITASSGLEYVSFDGGIDDSHYIGIPFSLGYDRQLSTRTTIGGRVSARYTDYDGPGNFRSVTPELTFQTALSATMTLTGGIGVSFAEADDGVDTSRTTGITANLGLCSRGEKTSFCGRASIDQQTATIAGPARTVNLGLNYSRQLGEDDSIQLSANASRYSSPVIFTTGQAFSRSVYLRGAADYSRRIGNRLFAGVNVSGRKISQNGPDPDADFSGSLFVRYRIGDLR